ncbi:MAG: FG-GAP repeat domain-containing protein, partial [Mariprofundaceae bacterium]
PTFADIDNDGDLDAFVGELYGTVKFYRNYSMEDGGTAAAPRFVAANGTTIINPLAGFDVGYNATPTFADIDNDGDVDAFVGERYGTVQFFENFEFSPVPTISLTTNGTSFNSTTNNVLNLSASTIPDNPPTVADLYVVLQLPNGTYLSWQNGGVFAAGIVPALPGWTPTTFNGQIFTYTFTGAEPAGTYTWLAAYVTPGMAPTAANIIGTLFSHSFTFTP